MGKSRVAILARVLPMILAAGVAACGGGGGPKTPQGWTREEQLAWYQGGQGSRLMPLAWFRALEQPGSTAPFADPAYIQRFGYLGAPAGGGGLPIGFAVDRQADTGFKVTGLRWYAGQGGDAATAEPWIGLNCAACHTAEVNYQGRSIRIDGGPGLGDYQSLVEAVDTALRQTLDQPDRWDRFAGKVLAGRDTGPNRAALRTALGSLVAWEARVAAANGARPRYGFARVDAFGHIYNKIALFNGAAPAGANPSAAPVSYPFLWDLERQDRVQWDGAARNSRLTVLGRSYDFGALGRNAGEVLGVFGEVEVAPPGGLASALRGYPSSLQVRSLDRMEDLLTRLESPCWPDAFPPIDQALAGRGKALFAAHCAACHLPKEAWKSGQPIERMVTLRDMAAGGNLTDIWMACDAATYQAPTGALKGTKINYLTGDPIGADTLVVTQLQTTVEGALIARKGPVALSASELFLGIHQLPTVFPPETLRPRALVAGAAPVDPRAQRRAYCTTTASDLLAYKARPLDGIWATAPYLHNGSVPTLYHLLLPPKDRPRQFWLGGRAYDPKYVGYVWDRKPDGPTFQFVAADAKGQPIDGDSNAGHDYGAATLTDADRWALVEYLKTL
jgi:mono/diheme cytochrome c family protein